MDWQYLVKSAIDYFGTHGKGDGKEPPSGQKAPPPPRAAPASEQAPSSTGAASGNASDVFSNMVDQPAPAAPPAPQAAGPVTAHTINAEKSTAATFSGVSEQELAGEATPEIMIRAIRGFDQEVRFNEGMDQETKLMKEQDSMRSIVALAGSDKQKGSMDVLGGTRALPLAHQTEVEDIESPAGRIKTMNILTQNRDPNDPDYDPSGGFSCNASTMVAGVLYAEGRKGLSTLLAATHKPGAEETAEEKALREKLEKPGEKLSIGDLQDLQNVVYKKLKSMEGISDPQELKKACTSEDPKEKAKAFVRLETVVEFMNNVIDDGSGEERSLKKMFQKSHLDISAVDNNADGAANHVVLRIADEDDKIVAYYDPWMKKGTGGQIINAQDDQGKAGRSKNPEIDDYKKSTLGRGKFNKEDEAPFAG